MYNHPLRAFGWKAFFEQQITPDLREHSVIARVSAHFGSQVLLLGESGEFRVPAQLAESAGEIAIGDWLVLTVAEHRAVQRLERQTLLFRKASGEEVRPQVMVANLDTIFIVSSCTEDFNVSRVERYLALAVQAGVTPVVVLTKADLSEDVATLRHQMGQIRPGLLIETLDARRADQTEALVSWCGPG